MKRVQLGRIERTLNALTRANRKRNVSVLERMSEEAAVLDDAFTEVRDAALDEALKVIDAMDFYYSNRGYESFCSEGETRLELLKQVRALKSDGGKKEIEERSREISRPRHEFDPEE